MNYQTLISARELAAELQSTKALVVLDCSSDLSDPDAGRRAHEAGHIPGAQHVRIKETLSGATTGRNGRNPLPEPDVFRRAMGALGVGDDTQVVAYDNGGGLYAARLWWMLRWIGHDAVAVLDGGWAAWRAVGQAVSLDPAQIPCRSALSPRASRTNSIAFEELRASLNVRRFLVLDARPADRFRGENETLDAKGGHIPGARSRPFRENLAADGLFKPAAQLRDEFCALIGDWPASAIVNQCGSGVSACHNLLAMEVAGLAGSALYPGSWSEWSAQPEALIATGSD